MNNAIENNELINKIHEIVTQNNAENEYSSINNILNICKKYINI
ncbi:hypothetical protein ABR2090_2433 [Acinetobacter baumannii]|nr:hypothetical protein ABR2090_2433 [Acinetobacter baumannii]